MRVLVCGGRNYHNRAALRAYLSNLGPQKVSLIITGAAPGADKLATEWAAECGIQFREFPANWKAHGRAAGPIRNQRMLDEGRPDLVVAFPGGRGTADMIRRAKAAGVMVEEAQP